MTQEVQQELLSDQSSLHTVHHPNLPSKPKTMRNIGAIEECERSTAQFVGFTLKCRTERKFRCVTSPWPEDLRNETLAK